MVRDANHLLAVNHKHLSRRRTGFQVGNKRRLLRCRLNHGAKEEQRNRTHQIHLRSVAILHHMPYDLIDKLLSR